MSEDLRLAEVVAGLSLATDLGMGQPLEQGLRTCLIGMALAEHLGLGADELAEVYYTALLRFLGCTADAHEWSQFVGGDDIAVRAAIAPVLGGSPREFGSAVFPVVGAGRSPVRRAELVARMAARGKEQARQGIVAHCDVSEILATRLGLRPGVRRALQAAFERWDGRGMPHGLAGEASPIAARISYAARDVEVLYRQGGRDHVVEVVRARRGHAYDPGVSDGFLAAPDLLLEGARTPRPWDEVLAAEPEAMRPWIPESQLDEALGVFADFADLKSPYTAGHSRGVAALAAAALPAEAVRLRRAGLVHDLGRVSVPNGIWDKRGPLSDGDWERVRLHPYFTERIVARVGALAGLVPVAGMHHERLDGSGYHRGASRGQIPYEARVLGAADCFRGKTEPRPHRDALTPEQAAEHLQSLAAGGQLDAEAVRAVLDAAGYRPRTEGASWPAGLTDREVEILRLICRGHTKKQVADRLAISPRTVDHHVRHVYEKAGVRSRAAATLFAIQHDLLH